MARVRLPVLLILFLVASTWAAAGQPDVVLVSLDTFRADRLAAWGGSPDVTPSLNALAARGTIFTDTFTPAPITLAAHATLLTGCLPNRTGLHDNGMGTLAKDVPCLAELMGGAGYDTRAVVASAVLAAKYGLNRGFAVYDDGTGPDGFRPADQVTDAALSFLKNRSTKPLFLWVHYFDTHEPYASPEAFRTRFHSPYDAAAAFVDSQVGRLLKALPPGAVVVVVADHGEALGEHGEPTHGVLLFQPTVHVPWVLAGPGIARGETRKEAAGLADVAPTLLTLLKVAGAPWRMDGAEALESASRQRLLPIETWLPYHSFRWSPLVGVTDGRFKWVRAAGRDRLYDLADDPGETRDLGASPPEAAASLRKALPSLAPAAEGGDRVDESLRGLGYAPVSAGPSAPAPASSPDPHGKTAVLQDLGRARLLRETGDLAGASLLYRKTADSDPGNPNAWFELGETLRRAGHPKEALAALDRGLALAPRMAAPLTSKGLALIAAERPADAAKAFEAALAVDPSFVSAIDTLAAYYLDQNLPDKAFPLLQRAFAAGTADHRTYLIQGRILLIQDKTKEAARDFLEALRLSPTPAQTLKETGDIYLMRNRVDDALQLYQDGIKAYPDFAPNYLTLGSAYLKLDKPEKALPLFRRALACPLDAATRNDVEQLVAELDGALSPQQP